ncbi:MAG: RDD family protein [Gemmatimonadales bacterium]
MDQQDQPPLASLSDRLWGQLFDSIIALAPLIVAGVLSTVSSSPVIGVLAVAAVIWVIYYILFADGFSGGQSFGKRMLGTACVDATTLAPCTFWHSFIRNLLLSLLGVIDWVFIFGKKRQRLGDKAANTIVIKVAPAGL